jgi:poly(3-hydroxybutyrate) depolymerase
MRGFVAMNPSNHARSHYDYFKDLIKGDGASTEAHRKFYDEYNAVLDMDANYYLQTIKVVFQDFSLVNGTWDIRNPQGQLERVRPQDIKTTALFSVEGELDDISGSGQTEAVHAICSGVVDSEQRHLIVEGAGHYGIFSGRRWREVVYPEVKKFILAHQPSPAPTATQSSESSPSITPTRPAAHEEGGEKAGRCQAHCCSQACWDCCRSFFGRTDAHPVESRDQQEGCTRQAHSSYSQRKICAQNGSPQVISR